jgi:PAS domain S-box-containing protein
VDHGSGDFSCVTPIAQMPPSSRSQTMPPRHSASNVLEFPHGSNGSGALLRAILDSMSHGVVALNDKDEAIFANERYREMFGISREVVPGIPISDLLKGGLVAIEPNDVEQYYACLRTEGAEAETLIQLTNGRIYSVVVKQLPEVGAGSHPRGCDRTPPVRVGGRAHGASRPSDGPA